MIVININKLADKLIEKFSKCIAINNENAVKIEPAIVSKVNLNGTVNIFFPPEKDKILTNIQNQSIFSLQEGDSVEILMPKGKLSNCWVIAKHQKNIF